MEIHIDDNRELNEIRESFSDHFPYLKLEFFQHAPKKDGSSPKSDMITGNLKVGEIRSIHNEGHVVIKGDISVGSLETEFKDKYGIYIQVFRNSGGIWLETSATDNWTLDEQNNTAREMSQES